MRFVGASVAFLKMRSTISFHAIYRRKFQAELSVTPKFFSKRPWHLRKTRHLVRNSGTAKIFLNSRQALLHASGCRRVIVALAVLVPKTLSIHSHCQNPPNYGACTYFRQREAQLDHDSCNPVGNVYVKYTPLANRSKAWSRNPFAD